MAHGHSKVNWELNSSVPSPRVPKATLLKKSLSWWITPPSTYSTTQNLGVLFKLPFIFITQFHHSPGSINSTSQVVSEFFPLPSPSTTTIQLLDALTRPLPKTFWVVLPTLTPALSNPLSILQQKRQNTIPLLYLTYFTASQFPMTKVKVLTTAHTEHDLQPEFLPLFHFLTAKYSPSNSSSKS